MKILKQLSTILLTLLLSAVLLAAQPQSPNVKTLFPVDKDGKWGFIDRTGKIVIPLQFDSANDFHEGLALVTANGKKLFVDASGRVVITPQFDIVDDFSEGLAAVNIGQTRIPSLGVISNPGKWGYIDKTGKLVVPLKFTHAEDFSEGLAGINYGDRDHGGFIDHTGKILFELPLDVTLGFHEGMVGVLLSGMVTYFDRTGKKIPTPTDYGPKSNSFSEGLVPISIKGKWGFMDRIGKLTIEPQFEDAEGFSEGLAPVKVKGETVWCPANTSGDRAGSSMMYGYIDKTGKMVIPAVFNSAEPFSEGVAAVRKCDQAFFIDKTGKTVIKGDFTYALSFSGGLARVETLMKDGLFWGYVDKTGKLVWGPAK
ncbi:MAG TPA: WG repeat-containing protein [Pyrinomonadaceae bacterium]|nr:WG repeat-containing protein [Pyrinomonadaceae bacterium]